MKNKTKKLPRKPAAKDPNHYPKGWNAAKVRRVIDHYENQTDDQAAAEDESAYHSRAVTMMAVPRRLVPRVQELISKRAG
jgi:hypothetical protein